MVHLLLPPECGLFTDGVSEVDVEADTVGRLIAALEARFPGLGEFVDRRMAIAIDGEIHQNSWTSAIGPASEVYLIPKIGGG